MSSELQRILKEDNFFLMLNTHSGASSEEIRAAYKKLVKQVHPDRFIDSQEKQLAEEAFKRVGVAFSTLQDPLLRKDYERRYAPTTAPSSNGSQDPATATTSSNHAPPRAQPAGQQGSSAAAKKTKQELAHKHYDAGKDYERKNLMDEAIKEYKEAIRIDNDVAKYHSQLALALQKKGWTGYAQAEFKVALHFDPTDKIALKHYQPTAGQSGKNTGFKWLKLFSSGNNTRLGDILIQLGHLKKDQLKEALKQQNDEKLLLGEILIRMEYIKPEHLAQALIQQSEAVKAAE
ncbi:MAG: DnaJ domain-containing protein [Candidatus Sericytochromatia bacterium]|nr:DnaJ domain-containing protein [Candidatus Sericytochromatia bacterium]